MLSTSDKSTFECNYVGKFAPKWLSALSGPAEASHCSPSFSFPCSSTERHFDTGSSKLDKNAVEYEHCQVVHLYIVWDKGKEDQCRWLARTKWIAFTHVVSNTVCLKKSPCMATFPTDITISTQFYVEYYCWFSNGKLYRDNPSITYLTMNTWTTLIFLHNIKSWI